MSFSVIAFLDVCFAAMGFFLLSRILSPKLSNPLPPGPKGLPIIGNALDMPSEKDWLTFAKWGEKYGDICSVTVLGQTIVVLNSVKIAMDMLDKKSAIYSDRPVLQMAGELVGWKRTLVLLPYGDRFRSYRRLFHRLIGTNSAMKLFRPAQELETHRFLRRVLAKPKDLAMHVRKTAGATVLRISHGYEVKEHRDPFVELADQATKQFSLATVAGAYLVDFIPALRHLPHWFPGAGFKETAKAWASTLNEMVEQPHRFVKQQMAIGAAPVSFTSALLEGKIISPDEESIIQWSAASLYSGAADTTVSAIYSFFLAMALNPDIVQKAQAEIDAVIGTERLPTFTDREHLPFIDAITKECFRWHSVVPAAVPHRVMQDDIHDGYFIPKGTIVIPNIWQMTHDPRTYANPMTFNPERFMGENPENDPRTISFGFGRRICPGLHFADASLFITAAMTLAVFDISKSIVNGVQIEPVHEGTTGTISHPKPFQCTITPRSEKSILLIQTDNA